MLLFLTTVIIICNDQLGSYSSTVFMTAWGHLRGETVVSGLRPLSSLVVFAPPHMHELMQWKAVILSALSYGLVTAHGLAVLLVLFALCLKCSTLSSNHSGFKFANVCC